MPSLMRHLHSPGSEAAGFGLQISIIVENLCDPGVVFAAMFL